jgi:hypothetical protein
MTPQDRAERTVRWELRNKRRSPNGVDYIMAVMPYSYRREWPQVAYDEAIRLLGEARNSLYRGDGVYPYL